MDKPERFKYIKPHIEKIEKKEEILSFEPPITKKETPSPTKIEKEEKIIRLSTLTKKVEIPKRQHFNKEVIMALIKEFHPECFRFMAKKKLTGCEIQNIFEFDVFYMRLFTLYEEERKFGGIKTRPWDGKEAFLPQEIKEPIDVSNVWVKIPENFIDGRVEQCIPGTESLEVCSCNNGKVECFECRGSGELICTNCNGYGYLLCPNCKGIKNLLYECRFCAGHGDTGFRYNEFTRQYERILCWNCGGYGKVYCSICDGNGVLSCRKCRGKGRFKCDICDGKGVLTCSKCKGMGRVVKYATVELLYKKTKFSKKWIIVEGKKSDWDLDIAYIEEIINSGEPLTLFKQKYLYFQNDEILTIEFPELGLLEIDKEIRKYFDYYRNLGKTVLQELSIIYLPTTYAMAYRGQKKISDILIFEMEPKMGHPLKVILPD